MPERGEVLEIGKGRIVREGSTVAILSLGTRLGHALEAAETLASKGISTTVADARFAKPIDVELVRKLARKHEVLITVEEGSSGGFGAMVMQQLTDDGLLDGGLKMRTMVLPDTFLDHDKPEKMYEAAGLDAAGIVRKVLSLLEPAHARLSLASGALDRDRRGDHPKARYGSRWPATSARRPCARRARPV